METENSFSGLNSTEEEEIAWQSTTSSLNHQNSGEKGKPGKTKADKPRYVRIMTVNCRSLRSETKRNDLVELIRTYMVENTPDIICATESHLYMHYSSSEVFPSMFNIVRKYSVEGGGYVFIATHKKLLATEVKGFNSDCEAKLVKVSLQGSKPLFIGSFYGQPSRDIQSLTELDRSLKSLVQASQSAPNIVLTEFLDFSKAFDTVPHKRQMSKLDHYGIRGSTDIGRWFGAWLWDRKQQVVDGEISSSFKVE